MPQDDSGTDEIDLGAPLAADPRTAETETVLPRAETLFRRCPACGEINFPDADACCSCQQTFAPGEERCPLPEETTTPPLCAGQVMLRGKYRLGKLIGILGNVFTYEILIEDEGRQRPAILRGCPLPCRPQAPPADNTNSTVIIPVMPTPDEGDVQAKDTQESAFALIRAEHRALKSDTCAGLPELLDVFREEEHVFLVEASPQGIPILEAWKEPTRTESEKHGWLEQIRLALAALHQQGLILPTLMPSLVVIDERHEARISSFFGLSLLPIADRRRIPMSHYTAPELFLDRRLVDARCDSFSFGALICALHLGRELTQDDFQCPGVPRPFSSRVSDALPTLVRLLGKTFVADVNARFPSAAMRDKDADGLAELGVALAEHQRAQCSVSYDVAGWSNTGMSRERNEDCFTVSNLTCGAGFHRRVVAFACLADGVGGYNGGDVASALAVSTVANHLRRHGLSSSLMHRFDSEHPLDNIGQCAQILREAVLQAHQVVRQQAQADPERSRDVDRRSRQY